MNIKNIVADRDQEHQETEKNDRFSFRRERKYRGRQSADKSERHIRKHHDTDKSRPPQHEGERQTPPDKEEEKRNIPGDFPRQKRGEKRNDIHTPIKEYSASTPQDYTVREARSIALSPSIG